MNTDYLMSDPRREALVTRALRSSEAQYRELCENVTDIVFTLNSMGDFTFMNRAGEKAIGYSLDEFLGMNFADIVPGQYAREARLLTGWQPQYGPAFQEMEIVAKDGRRLRLRLRLSTVFEYGTPAGVQAIARTQTQIAETDRQSRQFDEMDAIGQSAAGMAHDFNNVLTAILGYGNLVLDNLEVGSPIHRQVGAMMRAAQHAATLTDPVVRFSRSDTPETSMSELDESAEGVDRMLRRAMAQDIEVVTVPESDDEAIPLSDRCETVLVVDDEEMIRSVVHAYLRKSGYSVLEASTGAEAALIAEHHGGTIDLLLTDVVMPQMSGPQAAERLLEIHPEMQVLYMSGHSDDTLVGYGILASDSTLMKKPFNFDSLVRTVSEMIASSDHPQTDHAAARG